MERALVPSRACRTKPEWLERLAHLRRSAGFSDEPARPFDVLLAIPVAHEPVTADAHEPAWGHMHQEATQELLSVENHGFSSFPWR